MKIAFYQGRNYIGSFQAEPTFISSLRKKIVSITIEKDQ